MTREILEYILENCEVKCSSNFLLRKVCHACRLKFATSAYKIALSQQLNIQLKGCGYRGVFGIASVLTAYSNGILSQLLIRTRWRERGLCEDIVQQIKRSSFYDSQRYTMRIVPHHNHVIIVQKEEVHDLE